jgi:hypothetical protein
LKFQPWLTGASTGRFRLRIQSWLAFVIQIDFDAIVESLYRLNTAVA